jgi:hypothetical protein
MRATALALIAATALVAAATNAFSQTKPAPKAPTVIQPPPPSSEEKLKTSDQVKRESVQGAATAPLRDLNVVRVKIPEVLLQTLTDPYARPPRGWKCGELIALVQPLDDVLGPDIDRIPPGDENLMDRSRQTALGAAADFASDAIPFRGWVRKLTGAERHDQLVQSAIIAGNVRRAYLKGLGETRGCNPPGTPSHERAGSPPIEVRSEPLKPRYPTRLPSTDAQQKPSGSSPSGR